MPDLTLENFKNAFDNYRDKYIVKDYIPVKEELQEVKLNAKGYFIYKDEMSNKTKLLEIEVIKIDEITEKVIIADNDFNCLTVKMEELKKTFLRTDERFLAVKIRDEYRKVCKIPIDNFLQELKKSKDMYPEIWVS